jgi:hypothetical protein
VGRGLQSEGAVVVFARSCGSVCNKQPLHTHLHRQQVHHKKTISASFTCRRRRGATATRTSRTTQPMRRPSTTRRPRGCQHPPHAEDGFAEGLHPAPRILIKVPSASPFNKQTHHRRAVVSDMACCADFHRPRMCAAQEEGVRPCKPKCSLLLTRSRKL